MLEIKTSLDNPGTLWYTVIMECEKILSKIRGEQKHLQFAASLSVSIPTIYDWEKGKKIPGRKSLAKLVRVAKPDVYMELLESLGLLPSGHLAELTQLRTDNARLQADLAAARMP